MIWEAKPGSLERSVTDRSGEPVAVVTLRVRDRWTSRMTFEKNFVRLADCAAGEGKLVTTDLDGRFKYQNNFNLNGGKTIASALAAAICTLVDMPGPSPVDMAPAGRTSLPTSKP